MSDDIQQHWSSKHGTYLCPKCGILIPQPHIFQVHLGSHVYQPVKGGKKR